MIYGIRAFSLLYSGTSLANSLVNFGLRRKNRKSDSEEAFERQIRLQGLNHEYRKEEQAQGHNYRLKEQIQAHLLRNEEREQAYEYRLNEQVRTSWHRCREIVLSKHLDAQTQERGHAYRQKEQMSAHNYRLKEIAYSNDFQLYRDLRLRQIAQANAAELEHIRSQYAVQTAVINRNIQKSEENSPFIEPTEQSVNNIRKTYMANNGKPLVLIAPFWDDTRTHRASDEGGYLDYRVAINAAWQKTQWFDDVIKCDGYIKRPLRYTDRDIAVISAALADIPIILVHGMVQGGQRVHPAATIWNIIPGQGNSYFHLNLESFDVKVPESGDRLEFQDYVGYYLATVVGILSDAHHLVLSGKRPDLSRYAPPDEPEKLKLLTDQFAFYYDMICYEEPIREHFYRLDQAVMLCECGVSEKADQQIENSLTSWCYQKTGKTELEKRKSLQDFDLLAKLANRDDILFLTRLAEVYRLIGDEDKIRQSSELIESLEHPKYKPLERFRY